MFSRSFKTAWHPHLKSIAFAWISVVKCSLSRASLILLAMLMTGGILPSCGKPLPELNPDPFTSSAPGKYYKIKEETEKTRLPAEEKTALGPDNLIPPGKKALSGRSRRCGLAHQPFHPGILGTGAVRGGPMGGFTGRLLPQHQRATPAEWAWGGIHPADITAMWASV